MLAFHGSADPVAPVGALRELAGRLPSVEAVTVADGRHDVFNDAAHRSVAARTVLWLEQLRAGLDLLPSAPPPLLVRWPRPVRPVRPVPTPPADHPLTSPPLPSPTTAGGVPAVVPSQERTVPMTTLDERPPPRHPPSCCAAPCGGTRPGWW
ncbi:alpha/beta fold hydrolase [Kitasatospora fiedleri]|uniref:hypothetical protein n=1 Tax=Kitasatospora fiedleri TaxID=2991545 RepID=UPI002499F244|nr:hypothetical protein [Kitasatospora fiedleri]